MADEVWQPIPPFDGHMFSRYEVSSEGRVRTYAITGPTPGLRRDEPKLMTLHLRPDGYVQVKLASDEGVSVTRKVHTLVLRTFLGEPPDETWTASHMDGDGSRNHVSNLSWEPLSMNVRRQVPGGTRRNRARGEDHPASPLTADDVRAIRRAYVPGARKGDGRPSVLAAKYGISTTAIKNILNRKTWTHINDEAA